MKRSFRGHGNQVCLGSMVFALGAWSGCRGLPTIEGDTGGDTVVLSNLPSQVEGAGITYDLYCTQQDQPGARDRYTLIGSSGASTSSAAPSAGSQQSSYRFSFASSAPQKFCYLQGKGQPSSVVNGKVKFLDREGLFYDSDPKAVTQEGGKPKLAVHLKARYEINKSPASSDASATGQKPASQNFAQNTAAAAPATSSSAASSSPSAPGTPQSVRQVQLNIDGSVMACPPSVCSP